jgi:hypothetical protein
MTLADSSLDYKIGIYLWIHNGLTHSPEHKVETLSQKLLGLESRRIKRRKTQLIINAGITPQGHFNSLLLFSYGRKSHFNQLIENIHLDAVFLALFCSGPTRLRILNEMIQMLLSSKSNLHRNNKLRFVSCLQMHTCIVFEIETYIDISTASSSSSLIKTNFRKIFLFILQSSAKWRLSRLEHPHT